MKDIVISDAVKYIGADDKDLDLFESQYIVPNGVSYNSYVILDEKIAIMDTIDTRKTDEWKENLERVLDGRTPDYLVVSHLEPDHAGSIKEFADKYPEAKIVASTKAIAMLPQFFEIADLADRAVAVKEGEELSLGSHTLQFFMAPMVHWPEVMVEYEKSEKILFSADGFGKFGALDADEDWACEARRYYFNDGVLVAYASIHGNTKKAAEKMKEILEAKGAKKVAITDLSRDDMAEAIEDAFRYDKLVLAAASYDASVFPCMETFLNKLTNKNYQNRKIAIIENGSWAPTAARVMKSYVEKMKKITLCEKTVTIKSAMKDADVTAMEELADELLA